MKVVFDNLFMDFGHCSMNKKKETLCGDFYTAADNDNETTIVLSDGLGSGVKANILATLTAKILSTMMSKKLPVEEAVYTIASTLPVCKVRKLAYSTFTVFQVSNNKGYLVQYDNPKAILLRNGKNFDYECKKLLIDEKEILESTIELQENDMIIMMSDGVTNAGMGKTTGRGWDRKDVIEFCERFYEPDISPQRMSAHIVSACGSLYLDEIDDDTTVIALKIRKRSVVNIIIGPPKEQSDDNSTMRLFFSKAGKHIVCGGTTALTVGKYLNRPVEQIKNSQTDDIPAMSRISGVDMVTEGIVTLKKLVNLAESYAEDNIFSLDFINKKDAVSLLANELFEKATDVNIFFGNAVNPAHENNDLHIDFNTKMKVVRRLEMALIKMGKKVNVSIC